MRRSGIVIGTLLTGGLLVSLPIALGAVSGGEDLSSRVPSAYGLGGAAIGASVLKATSEGAIVEPLLSPGEPGLDLISASKVYGEAYRREVTWPSFVGPFHAEDDYVCGYSLYLGAGIFDTTGAGAGLEQAIHRKIARYFPYHQEVQGIDISLPAVRSTRFSVALREGRIDMSLALTLDDDTSFSVAFPVRLVMRNQTPYVERIKDQEMEVHFAGPSRDRITEQARQLGGGVGLVGGGLAGCALGPWGCLLGALFGNAVGESAGEKQANDAVPGKAQEMAAARVDDALADLAFGMEHLRHPFHPFRSRPGDELRLQLDADPTVTPSGITLPLCVRTTVASPKVDPTVPGPVSFGGERLLHRETGSVEPILGLAMNGDAVNQIVHYLWQSGVLREVGESSLVLDGLTKEARMAAFDFTGLDPELPPTLMPSASGGGDALPFVLGNVRLGTMGDRVVLGHGQAALGATQVRDSIVLEGLVTDVRINCSESVALGLKLTPCLADLLPVVRSKAQEGTTGENRPRYQFTGADVLGKLPQLGFQGMTLLLSDLQVKTQGSPVRLDLSVHARIR